MKKSLKERLQINNNWISLYFGWRFNITYETCGYFDSRPVISIALIFFSLSICLPFRTKHIDECNPARWGIGMHNNTFWLYYGYKGDMNGGQRWFTFHMPWEWDWVRTSRLKMGMTNPNPAEPASYWLHWQDWFHESNGNRIDHWKDEWKDKFWEETHPYTYILKSGEVQNRTARIRVEEREWRMRWLKWTPFPRKIVRCIDVEFNDEVGERSGSWKGGTIGCGYNLKPGETPLECLRRMEKERKF